MYRKGLFEIGKRISVHEALFSLKKKSVHAPSPSSKQLQHVQFTASSPGVQLAAQNNSFSDVIPLQQICDM